MSCKTYISHEKYAQDLPSRHTRGLHVTMPDPESRLVWPEVVLSKDISPALKDIKALWGGVKGRPGEPTRSPDGEWLMGVYYNDKRTSNLDVENFTYGGWRACRTLLCCGVLEIIEASKRES